MPTWSGEIKCPECGHWQIPMNFCPSCGRAFNSVFTSWGNLTPLAEGRALPSVEEVICPICQSIVRLYDGNRIGMHTPHSNVNEPICKMVGSEITPASKA